MHTLIALRILSKQSCSKTKAIKCMHMCCGSIPTQTLQVCNCNTRLPRSSSVQRHLAGAGSCERQRVSRHLLLQEDIAAVEPVPVYSVNPDRVTIPAKGSCQVEFFGFLGQPGQVEEHFLCTLGSGGKSKMTVFDTVARSDPFLACCYPSKPLACHLPKLLLLATPSDKKVAHLVNS